MVGGGPAGLATARALGERGIRDVLVLDRDEAAGGVPRHSDHPGYGLRDLRRSMTGPAYARRLVDLAIDGGARVLPSTTVTGWAGPRVLEVTSRRGRETVEAAAVVLATGCRERPRAARLVPGDRPAGVYTTGWLQRLVHLQHGSPGRRAVVVGAEHVSYSAVLTLAEAGCATVAMVTEGPRHTTYAAFHRLARTRWSVPLLTGAEVTAIRGHGRVEAVEVTRRADGRVVTVPCDTVVMTGDWVSENELARRAGARIDLATGGPSVDGGLRTDLPGVVAAGNLLHPAATADVCALDGHHAAAAVEDWLRHGTGDPARWPGAGVRIVVDPPLLWASPQRLTAASPGLPRGRLLLQTGRRRTAPAIEVRQGGDLLWTGRLPQLVPTRPVGIPDVWLPRVAFDGPAVRAALR